MTNRIYLFINDLFKGDASLFTNTYFSNNKKISYTTQSILLIILILIFLIVIYIILKYILYNSYDKSKINLINNL